MPDNENQYELDENYAPLGIVDAADGSGTTWPEFVGQVNKMDNQVAALTEDRDSQNHPFSNNTSGQYSVVNVEAETLSPTVNSPAIQFTMKDGSFVVVGFNTSTHRIHASTLDKNGIRTWTGSVQLN